MTINDAASGSATYTTTIAALSAPTVVASANPASGESPLDVSFSCMATDPDGTIILFEWDFDGDGIYDWSDPNTCHTNYQYTKNGLYQATIRATDNDGLMGTDSVTVAVGNSPTAVAFTVPANGQTPLEVTFTGTGTDPDGTISLYEWDFDGDGSFDWSNDRHGNTTYTYTSSGIFNAVLKVTDNDGLIGTDSVLISVSAPPIAKPRAYPTSGEVPLTVTFFSDGEDIDGSPEYFDWDFDGDGVFDEHLLDSIP